MESLPSVPPPGRMTAVAVGAAVAVALTGAVTAAAFDQAGSAVFVQTVSFGIAVSAVSVTGAVIALAVPGNRVGWLLLAAAAAMGAGSACIEAGVHGVLTDPGSVPGAAYLAALGPGLQAAGMLVVVTGVPAVFPDGHLPGPRFRWLGWTVGAAAACLFLGNVLGPHAQQSRLVHWQNPLGLPDGFAGVVNALSPVAVLLAAAAAAGAVAGLVTRWRRGGPLVRQQLKFLAVAACPPVLLFLTVMTTNGVPGWLFGVVLIPLPIAIAVAVLAHGLYDLRRAAHRTLLWLAMSGVVVGVYTVVVVAAAALVPGHHAWWLSGLAAAVAALTLIPLREKLQRGVTRVVYGRWHEPYEVLAGLGERLEDAADIDRLLTAALTELTTGLDLRDVTVSGTECDLVASAAPAVDPVPADPAITAAVGPDPGAGANAGAVSIPLQAYGLMVGSLSYRAPGRQLSVAEQRLVRDLARQLGGALHARLLREDLQRAREHLVLAREEERRAGARHCDVSLACTPDGLSVTVSDDGAGFRPPEHHGHGLAIMRERAEELGGAVTVTGTAPGVTVEARLPAVPGARATLPVPA